MDTTERAISVTVRSSDLLEAGIVALEPDEFHQVRGTMRSHGNGRCAYGVLRDVVERAGG